jgi:cell division protein FtsA
VCLTQEEKQQGVVLVDIGGGTTDIVIYVDGNPVFTKVVPIGGSIITKDIANVCQIPEDLAEKLKVSYGTCVIEKSNKNNFINIPQFHESAPKQISEPFLAEIIYSRVQMDILNQIQKAIAESGYEKRILAGVVLTGGGSMLRHIKELCQYTLQRNVRIGIPEIGFVHSIPSELKHPMFATSLGLLKHGIQVSSCGESEEEKGRKDEGTKGRKDEGAKGRKGERMGDREPKKDSLWEIVKKWLDDLIVKTS